MGTRVFISQPMRGESELGIEQVRHHILDWAPRALRKHDLIEIPKLSRWQAESSHPVYCLGHSLQNLSRANVVIFAPGWEEARGCRIEHEVCVQYHIPYIEIDDDPSGGFRIVKGVMPDDNDQERRG